MWTGRQTHPRQESAPLQPGPDSSLTVNSVSLPRSPRTSPAFGLMRLKRATPGQSANKLKWASPR